MAEPSLPSSPPGPAIPGNIPEYTVSEISGAVKRTLEGAFSRVRVRGEITEFKRYPSGHLYFSLKDEGGKIAGVVWRGQASRLGLQPENGLEVIATGRVTAYGERSSYQLTVERMEYAGVGALLARIERLKQKLLEEGLFDQNRKRPLPLLPNVIGIITSAQGAVLHDIRTTIARRFPRDLLLWPVPVQGEDAAGRIAMAIEGLDRRTGGDTGIPRPDVMIVARGGGSLEDLMSFNEENVLRAVAACSIPLISAVGHETDTTLIDFVSDRRAATPTAAAEIAVPSRAEMIVDLAHRAARLHGAILGLLRSAQHLVRLAANKVLDAPSLLDGTRQRLDDRGHRLRIALPNLIAGRKSALLSTDRHLPPPRSAVEARRTHIVVRSEALQREARHLLDSCRLRFKHLRGAAPAVQGLLRDKEGHLARLSSQLEAMSPTAVLSRGYAMVLDDRDQVVTTSGRLRAGAKVDLVFQDGRRAARIEPDAARQTTLNL
ncbi:exodeoxyribonuclease VII large subunit [Rhizosaccharibacter radicis]|uniref:Exodeoxyribonuclease 7 large subunit n=1 Tax=Rhizosaccharibacter radicis TaxID=2782605 RepID=A0ABT1W076_9PROT|nr:exodeoxyribonuclease VII large subunit [Acetobacteraceae bacterium KSS12]